MACFTFLHRTKHNSFEHNSHIIGLILCHPTTRIWIWIASSSFVERKSPKERRSEWNRPFHLNGIHNNYSHYPIHYLRIKHTHQKFYENRHGIFSAPFSVSFAIHSSPLLLDLTTNFKIVNRFHLTVNQFFFFTSPRTFLNLLLLHLETFPSSFLLFFFQINSGLWKDFLFWLAFDFREILPSPLMPPWLRVEM